MSALQDAGERVFYSKEGGDFRVEEVVFEIGGQNKKRAQIREMEDRVFVVKDDTLTGGQRMLPLHLFGFLY